MNHNFKDLTGKKFGMLTVESFAYTNKARKAYWDCLCDCGERKVVAGDKLRGGRTKSCGCLQNKLRKDGSNHRTHGMTNTKLYTVWCNMKARCYSVNNDMFYNYGKRGISVCEEWKNSFENFLKWAIDSGYVEGLSIERIDVDGNYEPANCTWVPLKKQSLNQRRSHKITAFGKTMTIKEWADETGLKYDTIERRINQYGWTAEDALTIEPHQGRAR